MKNNRRNNIGGYLHFLFVPKDFGFSVTIIVSAITNLLTCDRNSNGTYWKTHFTYKKTPRKPMAAGVSIKYQLYFDQYNITSYYKGST